MLRTPPKLAHPASDALCEAEVELLTRMQRYHEWAAAYRAQVVPEATCAFRLRVPALRLRACTCADLLPIMQMLRHDSFIRTLDLSGVQLGDEGAHVVADGLAAGAPLREVLLAGCGIGEAGAVALLGALLRNMHVRRVCLASNHLGSAGGAQALAHVLQRTRYLEEVDVRFCALGTAGLREVAAALLERAAARESWRQERSAPSAAARHGRRLGGDSWAWLFGGLAQDDRLVVTSAFQVKLQAPSSPSSPSSSAGGSGSGSGAGAGGGAAAAPAASAGAGAAAAPAGAGANRSASRSGSGGGGSSSSSSSSPVLEEDTLDISVHIGGNLVRLEILASVTHGLGLALTLVGAFFLLSKERAPATSTLELTSYIVYLVGLAAWFLTALLRHSLLQLAGSTTILQRLVPPAGFALVACTYTPFLLQSYACVSGAWVLLGLQWAMAALGGFLGSCYSGSASSQGLTRLVMLLYLLQGYVGGIVGLLLPQCLDKGAWSLLLPGGFLFTLGVFFYSREKPLGGISIDRAVWYGIIIVACLLHFLAVYLYVGPPTQVCYDAAAALGLAAGQEPRQALGAPAAQWETLAEGMRVARELLAESAERFQDVSNAGKRLLMQRLVSLLRDLLLQLEGGAGAGGSSHNATAEL